MKNLNTTMHRLVQLPFLRFAVVGGLAFIISSLILYFLYERLGMSIVLAQLVSAEGGVLFNFTVHNNWTFRHQAHPDTGLGRKLAQFHASSWVGVLWLTVIVSLGVGLTNLHYLICLAFATVFVMFWNYFWSKSFIFGMRDTSTPPPKRHQ